MAAVAGPEAAGVAGAGAIALVDPEVGRGGGGGGQWQWCLAAGGMTGAVVGVCCA